MTSEDEDELHRLTEMLRQVDSTLQPESPLREALKKAGLSLTFSFIHKLRPEIERIYEGLGTEVLSEPQREYLRKLGIDPDVG